MKITYCSEYNVNDILQADIWEDFPDCNGKSVFIKPNLVTPPTFWDIQSCTQKEIVEALIIKAKNGGATKIIVGCCGFKNQWDKTIKLSGYEELCNKYEINLVCVQEGENYHKYTLVRFENKQDYLSLFGTKISDYVLNSDVTINAPKMKVHTMAGITGAIKNMMGVISPKGSMHPGGNCEILMKRLRDLWKLMEPKVNWVLMDGIIGAEYSEQFGVPKKASVLISGTCMFEVDCMSAFVMGFIPEQIKYLKIIHDCDKKEYPDFREVLSKNLVSCFEKPLSWRKL